VLAGRAGELGVAANNFRWSCLAACLCFHGLTGAAAAAGDPKSCASINDDSARLACYDAAVGRSPRPAPAAQAAAPAAVAAPASAAKPVQRPAQVAPAPAQAPAAAAAEAAKDPVSEFGLSESAKAARDPDKAAQAAAAPQSVTAKVISVRWRKYGEFVVTLDNGQVWEQIEPMPSAIVKVGDVVTIKKALFGSFTLVTAGRIGTKVRRLD
jgi:hypothetical protein